MALIFFFFFFPCTQLLQNAPDEVLIMASSTICNLLLEFSPSKEVHEYCRILRTICWTHEVSQLTNIKKKTLFFFICSPSLSQG